MVQTLIVAIEACLAAVPRTALYYLVLALVGTIIGMGVRGLHIQARHSNESAALSRQIATLQTQLAVTERAAREASERARQIEQQRAADLMAAQEAHDAEVSRLRDDASRSSDALVRLRSQLSIAIAALRSGRAPDPASTRSGEAGATAAELLGACADRYRVLAQEADRGYAAGRYCERAYDALTAASAASK